MQSHSEASMRRRSQWGRRFGACLLAALSLAAWLGCGDATEPTSNTTGSPTGTAPPGPTSTPPVLDASLPDDGGGSPDAGPDGSSTCGDPDDVGSSEPTAKSLRTMNDDDSDGSSVSGIVNGAVDVDYYKLLALDTYGAVADPTLSFASPGVEICMFLSCVQGSGIDFKGCSAGSQATSDAGYQGCCLAAPGSTTLDYDCLDTTDESAVIYIRVRQAGNACVPYMASYHF